MPCCAFSIYCPLMGVFFFGGGDLRLGVCVDLSEVFVYGMVCLLEIVDAEFSQEMAGTSDWCPLMGGVCLWEVSAVGGGGGLTVCSTASPSPSHVVLCWLVWWMVYALLFRMLARVLCGLWIQITVPTSCKPCARPPPFTHTTTCLQPHPRHPRMEAPQGNDAHPSRELGVLDAMCSKRLG